jgi:hypothetical protein
MCDWLRRSLFCDGEIESGRSVNVQFSSFHRHLAYYSTSSSSSLPLLILMMFPRFLMSLPTFLDGTFPGSTEREI